MCASKYHLYPLVHECFQLPIIVSLVKGGINVNSQNLRFSSAAHQWHKGPGSFLFAPSPSGCWLWSQTHPFIVMRWLHQVQVSAIHTTHPECLQKINKACLWLMFLFKSEKLFSRASRSFSHTFHWPEICHMHMSKATTGEEMELIQLIIGVDDWLLPWVYGQEERKLFCQPTNNVC